MTRVCTSSGRDVTGPEDDESFGDVEPAMGSLPQAVVDLGFPSQVVVHSLPHADPGPTGQADKFAAVKLILGRPDQSDLKQELGIFREAGACTHTDTHVARTPTHAHVRTHASPRTHTHTHTQSLPRIYVPHLLPTHTHSLSLSHTHTHAHRFGRSPNTCFAYTQPTRVNEARMGVE